MLLPCALHTSCAISNIARYALPTCSDTYPSTLRQLATFSENSAVTASVKIHWKHLPSRHKQNCVPPNGSEGSTSGRNYPKSLTGKSLLKSTAHACNSLAKNQPPYPTAALQTTKIMNKHAAPQEVMSYCTEIYTCLDSEIRDWCK